MKNQQLDYQRQPLITVHPTLVTERIEVLDILRGLAIFGILLGNMTLFNSPMTLRYTNLQLWTGTVDQAANWLVRLFLEGKFYFFFAFLFGIGVEIQMTNTEKRGGRFGPLFARRMLVLLIIGAFHATLLWAGDILVLYAVLGFLLLLFRNLKPKTLLIWTIIFLLIPVFFLTLASVLLEIARSVPQMAEMIKAQFARQSLKHEAEVYDALRIYSTGNFSEVMRQRIHDIGVNYSSSFFAGPNIFSFFLLGIYAGKQRILTNVSSKLPLIRRVMWWGLGFGIIGNFFYATLQAYSNPLEPSLATYLGSLALVVGGPSLCLFYVAAIVRLIRSPAWLKRLSPLVAVGRTAISNYLFQSIVCDIIYLSYGFGLYGKVGPALGLAISLVIMAVQLAVSQWWMKRFQFGPVEWLWRSLTYEKLQPMHVAQLQEP